MSNRTSLIKTLICALILHISFAFPLSGAKKSVSKYTSQLPAVDKIELLKVRYGKWEVEAVEATEILPDKDVRAFASLWRRQKYFPNAPICHRPIYAVKLYSRGKLTLYASLCWECNNIAFIQPTFGSLYGFDGRTKNGQAMLDFFKRVFPS
jgi:hypothetical protein